MAITLDTTVSGETSNSYCDVAYADDYFTNHPSSTKSAAWLALNANQKAYALVQACYAIEQFRFTQVNDTNNRPWFYDPVLGRFLYTYNLDLVVKYNFFQVLQFPRNIDINSGGVVFMHERVKMAQCEQAIYMATLDETALANRLQGVMHDVVGVQGINLSQRIEADGSTLAPVARDLLRPLMLKNASRLRRQ